MLYGEDFQNGYVISLHPLTIEKTTSGKIVALAHA
jgi:hypothetical protein